MLVKASGSKYCRLKYGHGGKEKVLACGVYPIVTLQDARSRRDHAKRLLSNGLDPMDAKRDSKRQALIRGTNSFEAVAREWLDVMESSWKPGHFAKVKGTLETDIFPKLGGRPIADIGAPELPSVLKLVEKHGAYEIAHRLAQRCGAVFRYGVRTGLPLRESMGGETHPSVPRRLNLRMWWLVVSFTSPTLSRMRGVGMPCLRSAHSANFSSPASSGMPPVPRILTFLNLS